MITSEIAELRALRAKASTEDVRMDSRGSLSTVLGQGVHSGYWKLDDAVYFAAAWNAIPQLLDALERLEA